jgi:organic hydroperoxide reductase OsmC/OhrA
MQDLPHLYTVNATGKPGTNVRLAAAGLPDLDTAGPPEFGGPGDVWSPETMLVGAIANCFILSFRAIARTARLEWTDLECTAEGTLDKLGKFNQFTAFTVRAKLTVPPGPTVEKAQTILEKAEKYCLITNSMKAESHLETEVVSS